MNMIYMRTRQLPLGALPPYLVKPYFRENRTTALSLKADQGTIMGLLYYDTGRYAKRCRVSSSHADESKT